MAGTKQTGISNQLLGRMVKPKESFGPPTLQGSTNETLWHWAKPSLNGEYVATVQALYVSDGDLRVLVSDPWGNMKEIYFEHVQLVDQK